MAGIELRRRRNPVFWDAAEGREIISMRLGCGASRRQNVRKFVPCRYRSFGVACERESEGFATSVAREVRADLPQAAGGLVLEHIMAGFFEIPGARSGQHLPP